MMAQASSRFVSYERLSQKAQVEDLVLFGDKIDVKLEKAEHLEPSPSEGGTINFTLRPATHACPGTYHHSIVQVAEDKDYPSMNARWLNLIHHEKVNGEAVGKYLCSVSGHSEFKKDNVWSRYDWCHYRNWGTGGDKNELDSDPDSESERQYYEDRQKMFFVAVKKAGNKQKIKEIGRINMSEDCIEADWHYGLRLVDPDSKLAFAYVFGDVLVNDELSCSNGDWPGSDFNVQMAKFLI